MRLKQLLTSAPVLAYPKFGPSCSFVLETDASTVGLGAVLSQVQEDGMIHPITYTSRAVGKHEQNYEISEMETLGLVWAVRYFRPYLLGHPCLVYTDHAACLSILNTARPSGKLARWALTIQGMDITIKHKSGKRNINADALSHCPADESRISTVRVVQEDEVSFLDLKKVAQCQLADKEIVAVITYLQKGMLPDEGKEACRIVLESKNFGGRCIVP